jgi:archaellum component FlaC
MALIEVKTRLSERQFSRIMEAISEIKEEMGKMALSFERVEAAVVAVQKDLENVARLVQELRDAATDPASQAKLDTISEAIEAIDVGLDAIAPDPTV